MPAFGSDDLRTMFDQMINLADQLLLKWERLGPSHPVDVAADATRLTLDTIAFDATPDTEVRLIPGSGHCADPPRTPCGR